MHPRSGVEHKFHCSTPISDGPNRSTLDYRCVPALGGSHGEARLRRTEWLLRVAIVLCVLYAAIPVVANRQEIFPVFRWDLFAKTPNPVRVDSSVRLLELDGRALSPPVYLEEAGIVVEGAAAQARSGMERLARAVRNEEEGLEPLRARFEMTYLGGYQSGRYELVQRRYDILERRTCECYLAEVVLAEFDFDRRTGDGRGG
jgi:hypothetical protein